MAKATGSPGRLLETLDESSRLSSPGPTRVSSRIHLCESILIIGDQGPIGRIALSKAIGLGEGATRTILKHLMKAKIILVVKNGCVLSKHGKNIYRELRRRLSKIFILDANQLALDKVSAAILVHGSARQLRSGIEQRDEAVRAGATGACTLVLRQQEYRMPMEQESWKLDSHDPLGNNLDELFRPTEDDVVIIAGASNQQLAKQGALAAALTLLN